MKMRNRLNVLMAEKGIQSRSELHRIIKEQGYTMSRRTLDKFARNENNQIHYDTLLILCKVLECKSMDEMFVIDTGDSDSDKDD